MSKLRYTNSTEFKAHSTAIAGQFKNTKVSTLRKAMAQAEHFSDTRAYEQALDAQLPVKTAEVVLKVHAQIAPIAFELAYELLMTHDYDEAFPEKLVDEDVIMVPSELEADDLIAFATTELGKDRIDEAQGNRTALAQMIWEDLLNWASINTAETVVQRWVEGGPASYSDGNEPSASYLYTHRDAFESQSSLDLMKGLLKGDHH